MARTYCPECDSVITMADPQYGTLFKCPDCAVELEVISTTPFDVYFYFDEEWDDNAGWVDNDEFDYDQ